MEKIALVTGSSRGIGRAVATELARQAGPYVSTIGRGRTAPGHWWNSSPGRAAG